MKDQPRPVKQRETVSPSQPVLTEEEQARALVASRKLIIATLGKSPDEAIVVLASATGRALACLESRDREIVELRELLSETRRWLEHHETCDQYPRTVTPLVILRPCSCPSGSLMARIDAALERKGE